MVSAAESARRGALASGQQQPALVAVDTQAEMIALLEAKREREKRAALAAGNEPKEPSEQERKMATMPAWMLAIEKANLEAAWARWLQHIADDAAAKRNVRK